MAFLLGVCMFDLGDVHETNEVMERIFSLCEEGQIEEARTRAEATKEHIVASYDLSERPYMVRRLQEVLERVARAERERELL